MKNTKNNKIAIQIGVKALIFNKSGKVLLLKCVPHENSRIYWDMPGGRMEKNESLLNCLRREVFEETCIKKIKIGEIIAVQEFQCDCKRVIRLTYVSRVTSESVIKLSSEHSEYKWASLDELAGIKNLDNYLRQILKDKSRLSLIKSFINKG